MTIVKLKQWHSDDPVRIDDLCAQEIMLRNEIDEFAAAALCGALAPEKLTFSSNKVYKMEGNAILPIDGSFGEIFAQLAEVNCTLWHEQEKVYEFEKVPVQEKDRVVKQLALLNLRRNQCIDQIDKRLRALVEELHGRA